MFLPLPDLQAVLCAFINQHSQLTGHRYGGTMIIYSHFRLFLSCFCAAGGDPGRSAWTVAKVCSVLGVLYNLPIRLFNGRLDSGRRSIALSVLRALWVKIESQLSTARKSPAPVRRWSTGFYRIGHTSCETNGISESPWIFAIFRHRKVPKNRLKNGTAQK